MGGKIKNVSGKIKQQILSHKFQNGKSIVLQRDTYTKLIVNYSDSRTKKEAPNRIRGINKLGKAIAKGKLNKVHINTVAQ